MSGGWFLISSFSCWIHRHLGLSPYHILHALLQWFIGIATITRAQYHAVTMLLFADYWTYTGILLWQLVYLKVTSTVIACCWRSVAMYYLKTLSLKLTELQLLLLQVAAQCFFEGLPRGKVLKEKHPSCWLLGERPQGFPFFAFSFFVWLRTQ